MIRRATCCTILLTTNLAYAIVQYGKDDVMIEKALILALIAGALIAALSQIAPAISEQFDKTACAYTQCVEFEEVDGPFDI